MNICIIPARGGSKRIPRKNIKQFGGKPMIEWSISAAIKANCFDRIIVSTDDIEISNFAESMGVEVPFIRPPSLSEDYTSTGAVVKHALEWLKLPDISKVNACCLYATAPFVTSSDICQSLSILDPLVSDFVLPVTSYAFPVQRALVVDKSTMFLEMREPAHFSSRSQDLEESFHDAGQFCWGLAEAWISGDTPFQRKTLPYNLPRFRVQDIDTYEDWDRAELLHKALYE
ncbi:pseudaminic acid cytidylyltransferase [Pseudomonadales bacterium]|nr:pseudaminic acid cytidylyltransferase [Pseudomonadales bacterium]